MDATVVNQNVNQILQFLESDAVQLLNGDEVVTDSLKYTVKGTSGIPVRASVLSTTTV